MEDEHEAMSAALAATALDLQALARTGATADAETARAGLERTRAVVGRHLDHEEEREPLREHDGTPSGGWSPGSCGTAPPAPRARSSRGSPTGSATPTAPSCGPRCPPR
jgi:hypothetical protein